MKLHTKTALLVLLVAVLAVGLTACWGKKRESTGEKNVGVILGGCPPVDIVYVMDTSGSMNSIAIEVCAEISSVEANLLSRGLQDIQSTILGITESGQKAGEDFSCLENSVLTLLAPEVPGTPNPGEELLDDDEDWGPGGAIVAERFPWRLGAVRILVPISDEGAEDGGSGDKLGPEDTAAMDNLIAVALANSVIVSMLWGSNDNPSDVQDPAFITALNNIASSTGGTVTLNPGALGSLDGALFDLIVAACETFTPPEQTNGDTTPQ